MTFFVCVEHARDVLRLWARTVSLITLVTLVGGHLAECQGWLATAEARMACCADEQQCPMHNGNQQSGTNQGISQSDADRCCALSEHGDSIPTAKAVSVDSLAPIPFSVSGALPSTEPWFDRVAAHVSNPPSRPRHLLLAVFLI